MVEAGGSWSDAESAGSLKPAVPISLISSRVSGDRRRSSSGFVGRKPAQRLAGSAADMALPLVRDPSWRRTNPVLNAHHVPRDVAVTAAAPVIALAASVVGEGPAG